jgi:hypothetical protein
MTYQEPTAVAQIIHGMRPGETFSSSGRLHGVTFQATMEANSPTDPGLIGAGQESIIPPPEQPSLARGKLLPRPGDLHSTARPGRQTPRLRPSKLVALPEMRYHVKIQACISPNTPSIPTHALIVGAGRTKGAETLDCEIP